MAMITIELIKAMTRVIPAISMMSRAEVKNIMKSYLTLEKKIALNFLKFLLIVSVLDIRRNRYRYRIEFVPYKYRYIINRRFQIYENRILSLINAQFFVMWGVIDRIYSNALKQILHIYYNCNIFYHI